jgi:hypothetical protein
MNAHKSRFAARCYASCLAGWPGAVFMRSYSSPSAVGLHGWDNIESCSEPAVVIRISDSGVVSLTRG